MSDEFYVGYDEAAPPRLARFVRRWVRVLLGSVVLMVGCLAAVQSPVGSGRFEFGTVRVWEGVLFAEPVPFLHVETSGLLTNYLLVGTGKHGLGSVSTDVVGRRVRLSGTLIERDGRPMIEVAAPAEVLASGAGEGGVPTARDLGTMTLEGELVDTKCYLGVMRPATGKVHRGCAARCLSGGVPPGLLIRDGDRSSRVVLLAGAEGGVWRVDAGLAGRRLRVSGRLEAQGDLPVLRVGEWREVD